MQWCTMPHGLCSALSWEYNSMPILTIFPLSPQRLGGWGGKYSVREAIFGTLSFIGPSFALGIPTSVL